MTEAEFARVAAYLAKHCADWAGDSLCMPEWYDRPVSQEAADRFIAHIRGRLERIEAETRESVTAPDTARPSRLWSLNARALAEE